MSMVNRVETIAENNSSTILLLQMGNSPKGPLFIISLNTSITYCFNKGCSQLLLK